MTFAETGAGSQKTMKAKVAKEKSGHPTQDTGIHSMKDMMTKSVDEDKSQDSTVYPTQATDASACSVETAMDAIDGIMLEGLPLQLCPWHTQQVEQANKHMNGFRPLERYMAEGEADQSAVHHLFQEGTLSITKACTCAAILSAAMNSEVKN